MKRASNAKSAASVLLESARGLCKVQIEVRFRPISRRQMLKNELFRL
jgi:hypothetical protein